MAPAASPPCAGSRLTTRVGAHARTPAMEPNRTTPPAYAALAQGLAPASATAVPAPPLVSQASLGSSQMSVTYARIHMGTLPVSLSTPTSFLHRHQPRVYLKSARPSPAPVRAHIIGECVMYGSCVTPSGSTDVAAVALYTHCHESQS